MMIIKMKHPLKSICYAIISLVSAISAETFASERPNIIWIFSDDHAFQAIGAYGGRLAELNPTPNIDRLAREGMRFERAYVENSICAPSRGTLLTGKFSHLHGQLTNRPPSGSFHAGQPIFPRNLKQAGYRTGLFGKTHIALDPESLAAFHEWMVLPGQGEYYRPVYHTPSGRVVLDGWVDDVSTDHALQWLQSQTDESGEPFLLMLHFKAPHRTWMPPLRHLTTYQDVEISEPDTLFYDQSGRGHAANNSSMHLMDMNRHDLKLVDLPVQQGALSRLNEDEVAAWQAAYGPENEQYRATRRTPGEELRWRYQRYAKDFLRCVAGIDDNVGRVLDFLDEHGLADNTVIFYSSDQGFYIGETGWFDKRFMYEYSFRTPLLVRWPGRVAAGSVNDDLVQNIDFAPTMLDAAGIRPPEDMQGVSLLPLMKGERPDDWRDALYYHYYEFPGPHDVRHHEGVFDLRYKLIRFYGSDVPNGEEWEFYDLERDPKELASAYNNPEYASVIAYMKELLVELRAKYQVPDES
jgi:arylsulfatase A-like enzyme